MVLSENQWQPAPRVGKPAPHVAPPNVPNVSSIAMETIPNEAGRRGVVAVIPREDRVLVIRRGPKVVAPGTFCFPGGGIETHESQQTALVRELREELGVDVLPRAVLWHSITPWQVELFWWLATLKAEVEPVANPAEVDSFQWVTLEQMSSLPDLLPSNRAFLAAIDRGEVDWPPDIEETTDE